MTIVYKNPYPPGNRKFHQFVQTFKERGSVLPISEPAGRSRAEQSVSPAVTAATLTQLSDRLISGCTALAL